MLARIAEAACPETCSRVVEIGPGRGALTDYLYQRAGSLTAIEVDPVLVAYLRSKYRETPQVEIVEADILKVDLTVYAPMAVAGNLPYYITSPIIERVLSLRESVSSAVFLVQKEVAERMTSPPGSRDYGYLSVLTQFYAEARMLFTVPPGAFRPPPKVDSAVVKLTPRIELPCADAESFLRFAGRAFHQKRKTLRNNLLGSFPKEELDSLDEAGKRAEQMTVGELIGVFQKLRTHPERAGETGPGAPRSNSGS